jgi:hypothetical protein
MNNEKELSEYWNNKRPRNTIGYTGRAIPKRSADGSDIILKERVQIDVKTMVAENDCFLNKVINVFNLKGESHDQTMLNIQKWAVGNIRYLGDDANNYTMEYWQFPFETLADGTGDCEDGAILIASLALNAGIPAFRVRVTAGMVQPAPTAPQGGHAYVSYLRESDNQWVIIDWCYLEDSGTSIENKILQKDNPYYKEIWFSFNNQFSWADKPLDFKSF